MALEKIMALKKIQIGDRKNYGTKKIQIDARRKNHCHFLLFMEPLDLKNYRRQLIFVVFF